MDRKLRNRSAIMQYNGKARKKLPNRGKRTAKAMVGKVTASSRKS
jgi:hypothetical protein